MSDYQEVERLYKNVFEKKKDFESALHKYLDEIELYLQCYKLMAIKDALDRMIRRERNYLRVEGLDE